MQCFVFLLGLFAHDQFTVNPCDTATHSHLLRLRLGLLVQLCSLGFSSDELASSLVRLEQATPMIMTILDSVRLELEHTEECSDTINNHK